jgi:hydroxymethylbilane synthase
MSIFGDRQLRIGTRRSALALAQTVQVAGLLWTRSRIPPVLVPVTSDGDLRTTIPVTELGSTGVFVNALRDRLLRGDIDVAVHSLKDLPTAPAPGLLVAAIPERADPRDALVSLDGSTLRELPVGARVGTGSPRRAAQLRALNLGLDVVAIRGNVDSRIALVRQGGLAAVVLAAAGLIRLGLSEVISETIDIEDMLPAPAQGALAVECRADDERTVRLVAALDNHDARLSVTAERAVMRSLEAGCSAPLGILAAVHGQSLEMRALVAAADGGALIADSVRGPAVHAGQLAASLAHSLLVAGAAELCGPVVGAAGGTPLEFYQPPLTAAVAQAGP